MATREIPPGLLAKAWSRSRHPHLGRMQKITKTAQLSSEMDHVTKPQNRGSGIASQQRQRNLRREAFNTPTPEAKGRLGFTGPWGLELELPDRQDTVGLACARSAALTRNSVSCFSQACLESRRQLWLKNGRNPAPEHLTNKLPE